MNFWGVIIIGIGAGIMYWAAKASSPGLTVPGLGSIIPPSTDNVTPLSPNVGPIPGKDIFGFDWTTFSHDITHPFGL